MKNIDYLSGDDIEIVISAENNLYCAWQSLLAHYSCVKNLKITPLVVVHGQPNEVLHRHFVTLLEHGGRIQRVLNYRNVGNANYAPRNTAATLLNVETKAPYIMLCDTDFLFLNPIPREVLPTNDNEITFDHIGFMAVTDVTRKDLIKPAEKAGVDLEQLSSLPQAGGAVPHIIPSHLSRKLGADWIRCIEFFATSADPIFWISSMWGLVFAAQRLDINWSMTRLAITDSGRTKMIDVNAESAPSIFHYSYGNQYFNKRDYVYVDATLRFSLWDLTAPEGTISAFICGYLNEVKRSYKIRYSLRERLQSYQSYNYLKQIIKGYIKRVLRLLGLF